MYYFKTEKGYYYKENAKGEKKRISQEEYSKKRGGAPGNSNSTGNSNSNRRFAVDPRINENNLNSQLAKINNELLNNKSLSNEQKKSLIKALYTKPHGVNNQSNYSNFNSNNERIISEVLKNISTGNKVSRLNMGNRPRLPTNEEMSEIRMLAEEEKIFNEYIKVREKYLNLKKKYEELTRRSNIHNKTVLTGVGLMLQKLNREIRNPKYQKTKNGLKHMKMMDKRKYNDILDKLLETLNNFEKKNPTKNQQNEIMRIFQRRLQKLKNSLPK